MGHVTSLLPLVRLLKQYGAFFKFESNRLQDVTWPNVSETAGGIIGHVTAGGDDVKCQHFGALSGRSVGRSDWLRGVT